ncbi:MAG: aminoglycoside phosphotransferase family protein [Oscillospiraceae bacterium]|jgi:aminoglycoside phosphotransferase (APT) family kinase protein|nr:aminoglycoside phosphotransferase family protein [Oscillospiraceae bacterium]
MNALTKNRQNSETLSKMVKLAFNGTEMKTAVELTDGSFNAAYLITIANGTETVLKIAPPPGSLVTSSEKNIMFSEVDSMKMARQKTDVPVAEIFYYDNSCSIVSSEYFFMEKLRGKSLDTQVDFMSADEIAGIRETVGRYTARLNTITNDKFGLYGQADKQGTCWYAVFRGIIGDTIKDAAALDIDLTVDTDLIFSLLEKDRHYFEDVTVPRFVHWDLWDGNVFVENGKVTGLIDFERCLWADELMELGFRAHRVNEHFLRGYGLGTFSESQAVRSEWYDISLFLCKLLETDYRGYDNMDYHNDAAKRLAAYIDHVCTRQK